MNLDDRLVGRLLSRRAALQLLGAGGFGVLSSATMSSAQDAPAMAAQCVVRPEMTEGPYFLDKQGMRADIRAEASTGVRTPGVPLRLGFAVSQVAAGICSPLSNAVVDVWQCDAVGAYSGVVDPRFAPDTVKQGFLRGALQTDASGAARFMTIYPGWYSGRAVHIHFKIRTEAAGAQAYEFTSQLFLPESLTEQIHARSPYAAKGRRDTLNERDGIYRRGGDQLLLQPVETPDGYQATLAIALDLTDSNVGRADGDGGQGRGPRGGGPGRGRGGRGR